MGRRDYSRDWYCIFPLCQCRTYWNQALAGLALLAYYSCINAKSQELSTYYKQEVIAQVLQSFCENAVFTPEEGIRKVHSETVPCSLLPTVITQKT